MTIHKLYDVALDLFGEGESAGAEASQGGENPSVSTRRSKGELSNVIYGKQARPAEVNEEKEASAGPADGKTSEDDRRKAYNDLIRGEYKDLFTQDTQRIINQRFKENKTQQETLEKQNAVLGTLMSRYNVQDLDALSAAIDNDNNMWEEAADEAGMTVDQYKRFQKLQRENSELQRARFQEETDRKAHEIYSQWMQEGEALKQTFPSFNLDEECQNPNFTRLLQSGLPVEYAYKVVHMDDIVTEAMKTTASASEKRVVDNIRAKGNRPQENGLNNVATFIQKDDVSKLTRADRAEIARRAARGEQISF